MKLQRAITALALMVTSLSVPFAPPARPTPAPTLGAHNVIAGEEMTVMDVSVPQPATLPKKPFDNPNIHIEGMGRVVGFVLVQQGVPLRTAYKFVAVRWGFCRPKGCMPQWTATLSFAMYWKGRHGYRIPAGDYRLYLITDEQPVRIVLQLDGVSGDVSLSPRQPSGATITRPKAEPSSQGDTLFLGRGPDIDIDKVGLLLSGKHDRVGIGAGVDGECYWRHRHEPTPQPQEMSPGPHCHPFSETWGTGQRVSNGDFEVMWLSARQLPKGLWKSSYYSAWAGVPGGAEFMDLWVNLI